MHTPGMPASPGVFAHQRVDPQSASLLHEVPHEPDCVSQNVPDGSPAQSAFPEHLPHDPTAPASAPASAAVMQNGLVELGQGAVAVDPKSPLHALHVSVEELHAGVVPLQSTTSVGEHCAHEPSERHAGNVDVGHPSVAPVLLSPLQATQTSLFTVSQTGVVGVPVQLV
jgi:hypothetical protein